MLPNLRRRGLEIKMAVAYGVSVEGIGVDGEGEIHSCVAHIVMGQS